MISNKNKFLIVSCRKASMIPDCLCTEFIRNTMLPWYRLIFSPWNQFCTHFSSTSLELSNYYVASNVLDMEDIKDQVEPLSWQSLWRQTSKQILTHSVLNAVIKRYAQVAREAQRRSWVCQFRKIFCRRKHLRLVLKDVKEFSKQRWGDGNSGNVQRHGDTRQQE